MVHDGHKVHSVTPVPFYVKVEGSNEIHVLPPTETHVLEPPKQGKGAQCHTVNLWNLLLQRTCGDNRLQGLGRSVIKLMGEKSFKDCWTQINGLWLRGIPEFQFHCPAVLGRPPHAPSALSSSLGTCCWPLQTRRFHGWTSWLISILVKLFWNHNTWTRLEILQSLWRKSVSILGSWIIVLAA